MTAPRFVIFECGRKRIDCSMGCGRRAVRTCDFPVKRNGEPEACDRPLCERCWTMIGDKRLCGAHARVMKAKAAAEAGKP